MRVEYTMSEVTKQIKSELENTYDIPFYVREERMNGEPCYCIGPENDGEELFYIQISFRNKIRMTAEFIPEKYGRAFIQSMAESSAEDKDTFLRFVKIMQDRGGKVTLSINHTVVSPETFKAYQGNWDHLEIKVTKMPITEEDIFSYSEVVQNWGPLMMGMILSMADIVQIDESESTQLDGYAEGTRSKVTTNRYERNPINRELCLERQGYNCCVCGMNFEEIYGARGHHFIHVHHVVPISQIGEGYIIDPEKDLVPVCPNCHAMLHRKDPPYLPEELKQIISSEQQFSEKPLQVADSPIEYGGKIKSTEE